MFSDPLPFSRHRVRSPNDLTGRHPPSERADAPMIASISATCPGVLAVRSRAATRQPLAHADGSDMSYDPLPGTIGATVRTAWLWSGSTTVTARCTDRLGCLIRLTRNRRRVPVTMTGNTRSWRRCNTDDSGTDELLGTHAPTDAKRAVSTAISGGRLP